MQTTLPQSFNNLTNHAQLICNVQITQMKKWPMLEVTPERGNEGRI